MLRIDYFVALQLSKIIKADQANHPTTSADRMGFLKQTGNHCNARVPFLEIEWSEGDEEVKHHDAVYLYTLLHNVLANRSHDIEVFVLVSDHKIVSGGFWEQRGHNFAHVRFGKHFIHPYTVEVAQHKHIAI
jgi:hypothetical protein